MVIDYDSLYQLHRHWFLISIETFDTIHYAGMALSEIGIFMLNVAPLIALMLIGKRRTIG